MFVGENEALGPAHPNGAVFHQGLIIACRVVTDRHVLCLVVIDEKHTRGRTHLGSKAGLGAVGTDLVGGGQLLHFPLLELT